MAKKTTKPKIVFKKAPVKKTTKVEKEVVAEVINEAPNEKISTVEMEKIETIEVKEQKWVKTWTYEELSVLPRDEYLKAEADIRSGKAKVKPIDYYS